MWETEDDIYKPKRKVNNKLSWKIHNITGSFYSNKMDRTVEYESMGECLFYYLLELEHSIVRYYVQPLEIEIHYLDKDLNKKCWYHVPDVLVFRKGEEPTLFQIKESPEITERHKLVNKNCDAYVAKKGWTYQVVYPKQLPKVILRNLVFLQGAIKKRKGFDNWIPQVLTRVQYFENPSIVDIANSFSTQVSPLHILPVIYHLIAIGQLETNVYDEIDELSKVKIATGLNQFTFFLPMEGESYGI